MSLHIRAGVQHKQRRQYYLAQRFIHIERVSKFPLLCQAYKSLRLAVLNFHVRLPRKKERDNCGDYD